MQTFRPDGSPHPPPRATLREWVATLMPAITILMALAGGWGLIQVWRMPAPASVLLQASGPATASTNLSPSSATVTPVPSPHPISAVDLLGLSPIPVLVMPSPTATIHPQTAAEMTVVAAWTPTPTPLACPATEAARMALPSGSVCLWPTETPRPAPTSSPIPRCVTPIPGKACQPDSEWVPSAATPTVAGIAH